MVQWTRACALGGVALSLTACGDAGDVTDVGDVGDETQAELEEVDLGHLEQPIVGGTLVTAGENTNNGSPGTLPYGSTIRFASVTGNSPGFEKCSGTKIAAKRFLTAAHCVDAWDGNGQVRVTNALDPEVPDGTPVGTVLTVSKVYVHPTWVVKDGLTNWIGRPLDVAVFEVVENSSSIPTFNTPTVNNAEIKPGFISRLVGYGSGLKAWGDNTTVKLTSSHPFYDEDAMTYAYFIWSGLPSGESGDSGAPVFNEGSGGWAISGITSGAGPGSGESAFVRALTVRDWMANPTALQVSAGSTGYLVNAGAPACMAAADNTIVKQWACCLGSTCKDTEIWTLVASNEPGYLLIKNSFSQRCLQPQSTSNGAAVQMAACSTSSDAQKWAFEFQSALDPSGGNTAEGYAYDRIKNKSSGRCLSQDSTGDAQGSFIRQYNCSSIPANPQGHPQAWTLTR